MSENQFKRPTFGVGQPNGEGVTRTTSPFREESGAIWKQTSKANKEYMNIKIKMSKQKLQEILNNTSNDEVNLGFVAFPNKSHEGNDRRPAFRVYEEAKKNENKNSAQTSSDPVSLSANKAE